MFVNLRLRAPAVSWWEVKKTQRCTARRPLYCVDRRVINPCHKWWFPRQRARAWWPRPVKSNQNTFYGLLIIDFRRLWRIIIIPSSLINVFVNIAPVLVEDKFNRIHRAARRRWHLAEAGRILLEFFRWITGNIYCRLVGPYFHQRPNRLTRCY